MLDIGYLDIGRDYPIGKKLDNLCPKLLQFLMRQHANTPIRQYANAPTTFSTFPLLNFSTKKDIKILGYWQIKVRQSLVRQSSSRCRIGRGGSSLSGLTGD
jgi:hypothetical protein